MQFLLSVLLYIALLLSNCGGPKGCSCGFVPALMLQRLQRYNRLVDVKWHHIFWHAQRF